MPPGTVANNVPAVQVANQTVQRYLTSFRGVQANNIKVGIVVVDNNSGLKTGPIYTPLPAPVDAFNKIYYLDVEVLGQIDPLVTYTGGLLGPIPGLTSPFFMYAHGQEVFENPKGLTL